MASNSPRTQTARARKTTGAAKTPATPAPPAPRPSRPPRAPQKGRAAPEVAEAAARPPPPPPASSAAAAPDGAPDFSLAKVAENMRSVADQMLSLGSAAVVQGLRSVSGSVTEGSAVGKAIGRARAVTRAADALLALAPGGSASGNPSPMWVKTGKLLRDLRRGAGLTLAEVGQAVNLKDPELLAVVEKGRAALPFEIILRLAAVLGRNDPLAAVVALTRSSNPQIWEALEAMGFGKLMLQSAREREWVNVLRADDSLRALDDAEFARVLGFVKAGLALVAEMRRER